MVSIPACFSESYAEARTKFCSAAATAGGALRSWLNPHVKGPNGELLFLDTARFGPADAPNMLVLISSTHGVEGHCGSGAQISWLATGGTMAAAVTLLESVGGVVPAAACIIELTFLEGRKRLKPPVEALLSYDS